VQSAYIATSRELKRLDSLAMSPIFSAFAEVVAGLPTIRAFRQQDLFTQRSQAMLLASNRIYWPIQCVSPSICYVCGHTLPAHPLPSPTVSPTIFI
jgi:hypothetical protein